MASNDLVLVTGASGFIAKHCIAELLGRGYRVRGTLRRPAAGAEVAAAVMKGTAGGGHLEFVEADLATDAGWDEAAAGCRWLLHLASPFPVAVPRTADELVAPAVGGTRRVLAAAARAGVERTVLTSSTAAVYGGRRDTERTFTEADWADVGSPTIAPYPLSKALAERAAWEFAAGEGAGMELAVICPGFTLGPVLDADIGTSAEVVRMYLRGAYPAVPRVAFTVVDVRDVAALHVSALESPAAAGQRFICAAGPLWLRDVGRILLAHFPEFRAKLPTRELPDFVVRLAALFDATLRSIAPELGNVPKVSSEKAQRVLGFRFRPPEEAVVAMARSLVDLGLAVPPGARRP